MKTQDFVIPFEYENRRPVIIQRLLYIPPNFDKHELFEEKKYFDSSNDIHVEFCSGNGMWIAQKAKENPDINYIAVEMKFDRARKIWVRMHNEDIKNLFVVMGEGYTFAKHYLHGSNVSEVYINFPDPWPKKRHARNRIVRDEVVLEFHRIMKDTAIINLVTDDVTYRDEMIRVLMDSNKFNPLYEKPYFVQDLQNFGSSFFEDLFRKRGKSINYIKFTKK
ncbi:MAG: tRNA (guanosine(46)-N7)-methyltransferase TrmB [Parachlamydiales bacterium]|jgi:tRNA (guanine-N7-)-methyltransferase